MVNSQIPTLLFGDEDLVLSMPSSILEIEKTFVPVESESKGYCIQVEDGKVVVTRRNPWQVIAGLPSIYRFVGRLSELRQGDGAVSIPGTVTMKPHQKVFLSIWFGLLLIFLVISLAQAILLAGRVMFFSNSVPTDDLATIGFMLGSGALVVVIGIGVLVAVRLIFRGERRRLIEFCAGDQTMSRTFPDLPEWSFDIDEVSAGVYQIIATDRQGRRISKTGIDPEALIQECRREAGSISLKSSNGCR